MIQEKKNIQSLKNKSHLTISTFTKFDVKKSKESLQNKRGKGELPHNEEDTSNTLETAEDRKKTTPFHHKSLSRKMCRELLLHKHYSTDNTNMIGFCHNMKLHNPQNQVVNCSCQIKSISLLDKENLKTN